MRRPQSDRKKIPTKAELGADIERLFEKPGSNIPPIPCHSDEEAMKELLNMEKNLSNSCDWDVKNSAIERGMALVNGGILNYSQFVSELFKITPGLTSAATSPRSTLLKQACIFISQLAKNLGIQFDTMGDFITPLGSLVSHGTKIIADCTRLTIISIVSSCPSRRTVAALHDLSQSRGGTSRAVAAQAISVAASSWPEKSFEDAWPHLNSPLTSLLSDADPDARKFARTAIKTLKMKNPALVSTIISSLDARTLSSINNDVTSPSSSVLSMKENLSSPKIRRGNRSESPAPMGHKNDGYIPACERRRPSPAPRRNEIERTHPKSSLNTEKKTLSPKKAPAVKTDSTTLREIEFLKEISIALNQGRLNEVAQNFEKNAVHVLQCCENNFPNIAGPAFDVLHDLIPPFSAQFSNVLPKIIALILCNESPADSQTQIQRDNALKQLPQCYPARNLLTILSGFPNHQIEIAVKNNGLIFLQFISLIVDCPDSGLSDDNLAIPLLRICALFATSSEQKLRNLAARITSKVDEVNHTILLNFNAKNQQFADFIRPYIPNSSMEQSKQIGKNDFKVMKFDTAQFKLFKNNSEAIINSGDERIWSELRGSLYDEFNTALIRKQNGKGIMRLIKMSFDIHGPTEYHRLLVGLLSISETLSDYVDNIFALLLKQIEPAALFGSLKPLIEDEKDPKFGPAIVKTAFQFETRIIASVQPAKSKEH